MQDLISLDSLYFDHGYWDRLRQPAVLLAVRVTQVDAPAPLEGKAETDLLQRFEALMVPALCASVSDEARAQLDLPVSGHALLAGLLRHSMAILVAAGLPVLGPASASPPDPANRKPWMLVLPALNRTNRAPQTAFIFVCKLMNRLASGQTVHPVHLQGELKELITHLKASAPAGVNTLRFLQAAHDLNIPWRHVANNVYQFGWGRRARWLDSSFTDITPSISTSLARDKSACVKVLQDAGLPAPRHELVSSADQALKVAQSLGYPVVVKPANLDGGQGVFAGLRTPEAVERAYNEASKLSRRVLVEQFISGQDYRLQVYQGEVFWVVHRRPACVQGDGELTVVELISRVNAQRQQARGTSSPDHMAETGYASLLLDDEALDWLGYQGMKPDSVPTLGQTVRLRGAANVGMGGTREGVPLERVHPDNQSLAVQAAQCLRLDLAGIDLLVPDISQSWRVTGGGICEVNAQPQLSGHLQRLLLPKIVKGQGRIPVMGLCLPDTAWNDQTAVHAGVTRAGIHLVWADNVQMVREALVNPAVDAVVWRIAHPEQHVASMPVDALDILVLPADGAGNIPAADRFEKRFPLLWRSSRVIWTLGGKKPPAHSLTRKGLSDALVQHLLASSAP